MYPQQRGRGHQSAMLAQKRSNQKTARRDLSVARTKTSQSEASSCHIPWPNRNCEVTESIRKRWLECAHISWSVDDPRILHEAILRPGFNQIHNSNGRDWFSHDLVMSVHGFTPCCKRLLSKQSGIKAAHSSWGGRYKPCNPDLTHLTHCSGDGPRSVRTFLGGIRDRAFILSSPSPHPCPRP